MTIEDKIKEYREKIKALKEVESEIQEIVPDYLLEKQENFVSALIVCYIHVLYFFKL